MLLKDKKEIEAWLKQYSIKNYELIEDDEYGYVVNTISDIYLNFQNLYKIEIKFNEINGNFYCNNNKLESLEGCPKIVHGNFDCKLNELKTLKGCPEIVEGNFTCSYNQLKSLKYNPKIVDGSFNCSHNKLTSLNKITPLLKEVLDCSFNKLKMLKGCENMNLSYFSCNNNKLNLESLKYLPKEIISDYIDLFDNKELGNLQTMTNLKLLKKELKEIFQIQDDKNNLLKELPLKNKNKTISKI